MGDASFFDNDFGVPNVCQSKSPTYIVNQERSLCSQKSNVIELKANSLHLIVKLINKRDQLVITAKIKIRLKLSFAIASHGFNGQNMVELPTSEIENKMFANYLMDYGIFFCLKVKDKI